jgi:hypothetical protein
MQVKMTYYVVKSTIFGTYSWPFRYVRTKVLKHSALVVTLNTYNFVFVKIRKRNYTQLDFLSKKWGLFWAIFCLVTL